MLPSGLIDASLGQWVNQGQAAVRGERVGAIRPERTLLVAGEAPWRAAIGRATWLSFPPCPQDPEDLSVAAGAQSAPARQHEDGRGRACCRQSQRSGAGRRPPGPGRGVAGVAGREEVGDRPLNPRDVELVVREQVVGPSNPEPVHARGDIVVSGIHQRHRPGAVLQSDAPVPPRIDAVRDQHDPARPLQKRDACTAHLAEHGRLEQSLRLRPCLAHQELDVDARAAVGPALHRRLDLDHQGPPLLESVGVELHEALLLPLPRFARVEGVLAVRGIPEVVDRPHAVAVLFVGVELLLLPGLVRPRAARVECVLAVQRVPESVHGLHARAAGPGGVELEPEAHLLAVPGLADVERVLLLLALEVVDGLQEPPDAEEVHGVGQKLLVAGGRLRALRRAPRARGEALQVQPVSVDDHPLQVVEHLPAVHVEGQDAAGRQLEDHVAAVHVHVPHGLLEKVGRRPDIQGDLGRPRSRLGYAAGALLPRLLLLAEQMHGGHVDLARRGHGRGGAPGPDVRLEEAVGEVKLDVAAGQHLVVGARIENLAGHRLQPQRTALPAVVGQPAPLEVARAAARHAAYLELRARVRAHGDVHRSILIAHPPHVPCVQAARVRTAGGPLLGAGQPQQPVAGLAPPALVENDDAEGARLPVGAAVLEDVLLRVRAVLHLERVAPRLQLADVEAQRGGVLGVPRAGARASLVDPVHKHLRDDMGAVAACGGLVRRQHERRLLEVDLLREARPPAPREPVGAQVEAAGRVGDEDLGVLGRQREDAQGAGLPVVPQGRRRDRAAALGAVLHAELVLAGLEAGHVEAGSGGVGHRTCGGPRLMLLPAVDEESGGQELAALRRRRLVQRDHDGVLRQRNRLHEPRPGNPHVAGNEGRRRRHKGVGSGGGQGDDVQRPRLPVAPAVREADAHAVGADLHAEDVAAGLQPAEEEAQVRGVLGIACGRPRLPLLHAVDDQARHHELVVRHDGRAVRGHDHHGVVQVDLLLEARPVRPRVPLAGEREAVQGLH
mmetsp:Transcript_24100/g.63582  ORF Transcript_24100/g.63582 Transcript_24100/m.63582 type:complete len:1009 (+) Transcript_24100:234-3260(+)